MFETLLTKILQKYMKEYFEEFDSSNLSVGVWSGNVEVKNVQLKKSIFEVLGLPLEILYSSIGSVKLNVPWKNLVSQPIEIEISSVFIIICAKSPDKWDFKDYQQIKKKIEDIDSLRELLIKNITDKQNASTPKSQDEQSATEKMMLKILDNIQVKIEDIHLRFEDCISSKYSWGLALNHFEVYTCDDKWKRKYIDRTQPENRDKPLQKQLRLSNLGIYWIQNEQVYLNKLADSGKNSIIDQMKKMIIPDQIQATTHPFYGQYMILLSFETKLFQTKKGDFSRPEFQLFVDLETINLALENQQLQQIIQLAELFTVYQKKLNDEKTKVKSIDSKQEAQLIEQFGYLFDKLQRSVNVKEPQKVFSKQEYSDYENILMCVKMEMLQESVKEKVKLYQKEIALQQMAKNKEKKSKGWFGFGGGSQKDKDSIITDEDERQLQALLESALNDGPQMVFTQRPPKYVWLDLQFTLKGGAFHVTKQFQSKREGVILNYDNFIGRVQARDTWNTVQLKLKSIAVALTDEPVLESGLVLCSQRKTSPFLTPINYSVDDQFLELLMEMNPIDIENVDKQIQLRTRALEILYNPVVIVRLLQFADLKVDQNLKSAAWDQIETMQDQYQNYTEEKEIEDKQKQQEQQLSQLPRKVLSIDINIAAPVIILPIQLEAGDQGAVWWISLGELSVQTPQYIIKNPNEGYFDEYQVDLRNLSFKYYNTLKLCRQQLYLQANVTENEVIPQTNEVVQYNLIRNFSIKITAKILRENLNPPTQLPKIQIDGVLQSLDLQLQPTIYERILKLGNCFAVPEEDRVSREKSESILQAATEKTQLMKNAKKISPIFRQNSQLKTWTKYTGILSDGYIYLFAKPKDTQPESYIWVKNSDFVDQDSALVGMNNAFQIKNKYGEAILATEKPEQSKQWKDAIEAIRTIARPKVKSETKLRQVEVQKAERSLKLSFEFKSIGLKLQNKQCIEWVSLDVENLSAVVDKTGDSIDLTLKLQSLYMKDTLLNYLDDRMRYIINSNPFQQDSSNDLIVLRIKQIGEKAPDYKNINLDVDIEFGTIQVILKPMVIANLLLFVTPQQIEEPVIAELENSDKKQKQEAKKKAEDGALAQNNALNFKVDIIIMKVSVLMKSVSAVLVHRFTNLPIAEVSVQTTRITFIKKLDEMLLDGSLGNLLLFDMTNYPNTLSQESDWQLIRPVQMLGVNDSGKSLLSIKFRGLTEGSPKIGADNVTTFIELKMSQITINLMMQPLLRILDYSLSQLLFSLSNPQQTVNADYGKPQIVTQTTNQVNENDGSQSPSIFSSLTDDEKQFLIKQLTKPAGMSLLVDIENPQVVLKPSQNSDTGLIIDLGHIKVTNKRHKSSERILFKGQYTEEGVWVDTFNLVMQNICMFEIDERKQEKTEVTLPFDFNVSVEMCGMAPQYKLIYPALELDVSLKIRTYLAPMIIQLTHESFIFLMKCLFHNIAYDDGFDTMIRNQNPKHYAAFFKQQEQQKLLAKLMLEKGDTSLNLSFTMDAENLTIFLKTSQTPQLESVPFFRVTLVMLRVQFQKLNNGNSKVSFLAQGLEGSVFSQKPNGDFLEEPLLGSMSINQVYSLAQMTRLLGLIQSRRFSSNNSQQGKALELASQGQLVQDYKRNQVFSFEDADASIVLSSNNCKLVFGLEMRLNGDKQINLDLADFKLAVNADPLFQVLGVVQMNDPTLTPSEGKYIQQQKQQQQKQNEQVAPPVGGSLKIDISLRNVVICAPTNVDDNVLAIRGEFQIRLVMNAAKSLEQVKNELLVRNIQILPGSDTREADELNELMSVQLDIIGLEICICKVIDLARQVDFKQIKKREILRPLKLNLEIKKILSLTKNLNGFDDLTRINARLSRTELKICFKDIFLLQSGMNYQMKSLPKSQQNQEEVKQVEENKDEEYRKKYISVDLDQGVSEQLQQLENKQIVKQKINAMIQSIDIIILNDMGTSFTPLLNFELQEINMLIDRNNLFQTIGMTLPFRLNYFNPRVGRWEPVIERCAFNIEYYSNNFGPKLGGTVLTIEQHPEYPKFNIILSTMFFQSLFRTLYLVRKMQEKDKKPQNDQIDFEERKSQNIIQQIGDEQEVEDELFTQVSAYAVRNLTGYKIEVIIVDEQGKKKRQSQINLTLNNKQQSNINFDQDEEQINNNLQIQNQWEEQVQYQKRIRISIHIDGKTYKTREVDMDRIKQRVEKIDQNLPIYTSLQLDELTNSKILTISSPIMFVNQTSESIIVLLSDKSHPTVEFEMDKYLGVTQNEIDHSCALPVGYLNTRVKMRFKSCPDWSDEISIEKLIQKDNSAREIQMRDSKFVVFKMLQNSDAQDRFKIEIQPPMKFTNSLPKSIHMQTLNHNSDTLKTFKLKKGQSVEEYNLSSLKRSYMRVLLEGFYWSDEHKMYNQSIEQDGAVVTQKDCILELPVVDMLGGKLSLLVYEPWRMDESIGCKEFVIHSQGYLINQSPYSLNYATISAKNNVPIQIPGQFNVEAGKKYDSNCVIMGPECGDQLALSIKYSENYSQNPTSIMGIGACQLDLILNEDGFTRQIYMGGNIQLKLCNSQHLLFTKVISVEPRFIFVNQTSHTLQVRSAMNQEVTLELQPQQRTPYSKYYNAKFRKIEDKIYINLNLPQSEDFQWSGDLDIATIGIMYFQLNHTDIENKKVFFSADTRQQGCNIFIIVNEIPKNDAPYKVQNFCSEIRMIFDNLAVLEDETPYYFAWNEPCTQKKKLKLELQVRDENLEQKAITLDLNPDQLGYFKPIKIHNIQKGRPLQLALTITPEGFQKQIVLNYASVQQLKQAKLKTNKQYFKNQLDNLQDQEEESKQEIIQRPVQSIGSLENSTNNKIVFMINQVSISLMHNSDPQKRPAECLNLTFKTIELIQLTTDISKITQIRVKYLNFDNNSQFYVNYPVILTPTKHKSYQLKEKYFFNFLISQNTKVKDIILLNGISFDIEPFTIKIEDQLTYTLMDFANSIFVFKTKIEDYEKRQEMLHRPGSQISENFQSKISDVQYSSKHHELQQLHWYSDELPPSSLPTYISEIIISPIIIELTFSASTHTSDLQNDNLALAPFKSFAAALGVVLTNIDEAPIHFTGLQLIDCFDTTSGIINKMALNYRDQGMKQVLKLLGSLSLLGNPVGLFNNISTGVTDLIERPAEGFTKGPLEGGLGLVQGAGSLVSHTIAGAFNSVNKITGSVSSGIASLSMDQEYIQQREQMRMQKPKHIGQGFEQAGKSLFQGFSQGIAGVFYKPFQGAQKEGLKGFGKGLVQGGVGLFTKPITGLLDAAAKTTEGIKNTALYFDDKPNDTRERNIRPIYGHEGYSIYQKRKYFQFSGYYTQYVDFDAEAMTAVQLIRKGRYVKDRLFSAFQIDDKFMFIITVENLFYMSIEKGKKVWIISMEDYVKVQRNERGLKLFTMRPVKDINNKQEVQLDLPESLRLIIENQIKQLKKIIDYLS